MGAAASAEQTAPCRKRPTSRSLKLPRERLTAAAPAAQARAPLPAPVPLGPITDWGVLRERVAGCTACDLCKTRTQTVFGVGNTRAEWLIIGEAPGRRRRPAG